MNNKYKGKRIEFHILQSFPVTCLNRDDVGAPKSAIVGGVARARVSSQCWKRQVRLAMQDFGIKLAVRTKHVDEKIAGYCIELNATEQQAAGIGKAIADILTKDTLHFFTDTEAKFLAQYAKDHEFNVELINAKEIVKEHAKAFGKSMKDLDGLDIALFGRMVAQATELDVEAAASFSHAISTHKATSEVEFFTALDDISPNDEINAGSSHMGSMEFNSATYYRYISLDLGQLVQTLGGDEDLDKAIEAFVKALYIAVPSARQTTQAGNNLWDYARIYIRKGQGLQVSFDEPVKSKGEGFLKPSIEAMDRFLDKKESLSGSLFGKIEDFRWGVDEHFSIDNLIEKIQQTLKR